MIRTTSGRASWSTWSSASPADGVAEAAGSGRRNGTPFAGTFVCRITLNYGSATINADRVGSERTPTIALSGPANRENVCDRSHPRLGTLRPVANLFNTKCGQAAVTTRLGPLVAEADDDQYPVLRQIGAGHLE